MSQPQTQVCPPIDAGYVRGNKTIKSDLMEVSLRTTDAFVDQSCPDNLQERNAQNIESFRQLESFR